VANSLAALAAGVGVVHTTVSGIGERAGNTPMEDLALALRMLYAASHNLDTSRFYALSRLVRERAGHDIPSNRAAVGDRLFEVESGIIAGWYARCIENDPTELYPYHWDEVGQSPGRVVYGKGSGLPSIMLALAALGISADEEEMRGLLSEVKARGLENKALLSLEEVARLANERQALAPTAGR
jgi:isopropylmalate/homocitrate/citramalate synthase